VREATGRLVGGGKVRAVEVICGESATDGREARDRRRTGRRTDCRRAARKESDLGCGREIWGESATVRQSLGWGGQLRREGCGLVL
jgi:hypothetical protein